MQTTNALNLNINHENIKNNKINFLVNIIIPIYTIITTVMGLYYFITGESEFKNYTEDTQGNINLSYKIENHDKLDQRSTGIYFLLLASVGCIMIILRSLINRNWINLIGIVLIICFILLTCYVEFKVYSKDYYLNIEMELSELQFHYSIYERISEMQYFNVIKYIEDKFYYNSILSEDDIKKINTIDKIGFNFKVFCYTYLWELINITITTICIIPIIIMLYKNKIQFNLELINAIIISLTFILCLIYLITNLRRKTPISLNITGGQNKLNGFIFENKAKLEKYNNLFLR